MTGSDLPMTAATLPASAGISESGETTPVMRSWILERCDLWVSTKAIEGACVEFKDSGPGVKGCFPRVRSFLHHEAGGEGYWTGPKHRMESSSEHAVDTGKAICNFRGVFHYGCRLTTAATSIWYRNGEAVAREERESACGSHVSVLSCGSHTARRNHEVRAQPASEAQRLAGEHDRCCGGDSEVRRSMVAKICKNWLTANNPELGRRLVWMSAPQCFRRRSINPTMACSYCKNHSRLRI